MGGKVIAVSAHGTRNYKTWACTLSITLIKLRANITKPAYIWAVTKCAGGQCLSTTHSVDNPVIQVRPEEEIRHCCQDAALPLSKQVYTPPIRVPTWQRRPETTSATCLAINRFFSITMGEGDPFVMPILQFVLRWVCSYPSPHHSSNSMHSEN
jgi:hypothetical protein